MTIAIVIVACMFTAVITYSIGYRRGYSEGRCDLRDEIAKGGF